MQMYGTNFAVPTAVRTLARAVASGLFLLEQEGKLVTGPQSPDAGHLLAVGTSAALRSCGSNLGTAGLTISPVALLVVRSATGGLKSDAIGQLPDGMPQTRRN